MGKIHAIWRTRLVATSSPYGELGLSRPACHIGSSACPDQLAIWRAQPVPTELATSVYPDQLAIWRARSFSTSSPYGELGWSLPTRQLRLYHINIMHSRSSLLRTVNALSLVSARLELPLKVYDTNCGDLFSRISPNWSYKMATVNLKHHLPWLYDLFKLFHKTNVVPKTISLRNCKNA